MVGQAKIVRWIGLVERLRSAEEKARQRRKKISRLRWRKRLRLVGLFLILAVLVWGGVKLYNSSFFNIRKVEVEGNRHLSDEQVIELSGVTSRTSLLKLSTREIEEKLLNHSWIKGVEAERHLPNSLEIKVVERVPAAIIPLKEGFVLVDGDCFALECLESTEGLNLPLIRDLTISDFEIGEKMRSTSLSNAITCLVHLEDPLKGSLSIISAPSVDKLSLYTKDGVEIIYGKAEETKKKNYVLREILSKDSGKVIFIDIRVLSNPVVKRLERS